MGFFSGPDPIETETPEPRQRPVNADLSEQAAILRRMNQKRRTRESLVIDTGAQVPGGSASGLVIPTT